MGFQVVTSSATSALFGTVARWRGARALHPRGAVQPATVHRDGLASPTGVVWLDEPGEDRVLVRFSRSAGLPHPLPDVHGLALRITVPDGSVADLLLSSTGRLPGLRHVLRPAVSPMGGYTCIVPFHTPTGALMIGAFPEGDGFSLQVAPALGCWRRFGRLELDIAPMAGRDREDLDLDPALHPLPGLRMPSWLVALRGPAYRASRDARSHDTTRESR
jgi:hypothetical protein